MPMITDLHCIVLYCTVHIVLLCIMFTCQYCFCGVALMTLDRSTGGSPAWHFCLSHLRQCRCAGCRVVSWAPPFPDVLPHYSRDISGWWGSGRDISLPLPAPCLGSFFSPRLVLPPELEASLLCLLCQILEGPLSFGTCYSKGFQEPLGGCPGEVPTPDFHWEGERSPSSLKAHS